MINRLAVFLYLAIIGLFSLFWLPCYLGTVGGPPWSFNFYLKAVAGCQLPLTIIAALLLGLRWVSRARAARKFNQQRNRNRNVGGTIHRCIKR